MDDGTVLGLSGFKHSASYQTWSASWASNLANSVDLVERVLVKAARTSGLTRPNALPDGQSPLCRTGTIFSLIGGPAGLNLVEALATVGERKGIWKAPWIS
jgi:hypothetical protein